MKNAVQLKAKIKNRSKELRIPAQTLLQTYFTERLLARIAASQYQSNFVFKGGFLIASVVGHDSRSTMDLDVTLKGKVLDEQTLRSLFHEILLIETGDGITFEMKSIAAIREDSEYSGLRVSLVACYGRIANTFHVDITTGDAITPGAINYEHQPLFDEEPIPMLVYPLETILAEKIETILKRVDQNTRLRDYYDVFLFAHRYKNRIDPSILNNALLATIQSRGTGGILDSISKRIKVIAGSEDLQNRWIAYQSEYSYAQGIEFESTLESLTEILGIAELLDLGSYQSSEEVWDPDVGAELVE